uniref:Uncharacterized protein n=1 Tax=Rhizophora mucronata TaxID=61149 RepID=A0A2P2PP58_RHIMU
MIRVGLGLCPDNKMCCLDIWNWIFCLLK